MKSRHSQDLMLEISKILGVSKQQVNDVIKSSFEFQHYVQTQKVDIDNDIVPSVRIPGFGIFCRNQLRVKLYKEHKRKKNELINVE